MRCVSIAAAIVLATVLAGCAGVESSTVKGTQPVSGVSGTSASAQESTSQEPKSANSEQKDSDKKASEISLSIDGTDVDVAWEDNPSVDDLKAVATNSPLALELHTYGNFEQVGPLGTSLTANDEQITTEPGDIVLYAGDQISIFYGSNTWAYTKLGHITNKTAPEMADLLSNETVSVGITIQ